MPCEADEIDEALATRFGPFAEGFRPGTLVGDLGAITERLGQYVEAGAQWVILALRAPFDLGALARSRPKWVPQFR